MTNMSQDDKADVAVLAGILGLLGLVSMAVVQVIRRERALVREIDSLRNQPAKPRWTDANRWDRD